MLAISDLGTSPAPDAGAKGEMRPPAPSPSPYETRPVSTGRGTRRVQLLREGGGGGEGSNCAEAAIAELDRAAVVRLPLLSARLRRRVLGFAFTREERQRPDLRRRRGNFQSHC